MTTRRERIFEAVMVERARQDDQWGVQRHPWPYWAAILAEETGEVCREAIAHGVDRVSLEREVVHTAAVAVAMLEHLSEEGGR